VWYGAVVRGDANSVVVGACSNVGAKAALTTVEDLESGFPAVLSLGDYVSVGAGATLTSCTIEHNVVVGDGAVVGAGAVVQTNAVLAPGTVVPAGGLIPAGERWAGNPAAFHSKLEEEDLAASVAAAEAVAVAAAETAAEYEVPPGAP